MATTYKTLGTITLSSDVVSITFSSIPSSYTDLVLKVSARSDYAAIVDYLNLKFNGDSSAIYTEGRMVGYGTTGQAADRVTGQTYVQQFPINGASSTTSAYSAGEIYIPNYSGSQAKSFLATGVVEHNTTSNNQILMEGGLYDTGTAISSITMSSANGTVLKSGSTFFIYGIEKFGTSGSGTASTASVVAKATGGTIKTDGSYVYHTFTSTGTFTPTQSLSVDYLVVAGGGGGYSGGGGAGGYRTATSQSVTATGYAITVGAGAAYGSRGSSSSFASFAATGGGTGGNTGNKSGGSGGGGARDSGSSPGTGNLGGYSPSEGNNGAGNTATGWCGGGGGGGIGAAGTAGDGNGGPNGEIGGNGGIGSYTAISGGATTGAGQLSSGNYYFAGGGGGAIGSSSGTPSSGGIGGGGYGGNQSGITAANGTANTGGGGGGGASGTNSGSGGSGIVIVRYAV